MILNIFNQ